MKWKLKGDGSSAYDGGRILVSSVNSLMSCLTKCPLAPKLHAHVPSFIVYFFTKPVFFLFFTI